jgi:predicted methyltransferase MtxX (methanogen marker protein 4)
MAKAKYTVKVMVKIEAKTPRRHSPRAIDETNVAMKLRMAFLLFRNFVVKTPLRASVAIIAHGRTTDSYSRFL